MHAIVCAVYSCLHSSNGNCYHTGSFALQPDNCIIAKYTYRTHVRGGNLSEQTPNHLVYLTSTTIDTRNVQFTRYSSTCMRSSTQGNADHSVTVFSRPAHESSSAARWRRHRLFIFHTTDSSRKLSQPPSQSSYFRYRMHAARRRPDGNRRDTFSRSIHP